MNDLGGRELSVLAAMTPSSIRVLLLGASAFLLYGAGRLIMGAVPARADRPGLRALLGAAMVLSVTIVAILMDRAELGLHLPIACAMAAMTFGIAALILGRPVPEAATGNRSWGLIAPAIAIALIGGLGGRLDAAMLIALAVYGVVAILGWREPAAAEGEAVARGGPGAAAMLLWIGGIALSTLAGVLVMLGLPALEASGVRADALAVVFLLAPAIVVPIFFELLPPCRSLGWNASASVLVKFAVLNLCFVLPLASLVQADVQLIRGLWATQSAIATTTQPTTMTSPIATSRPATQLATQPADQATASADAATRLVFPRMPSIALRVDLLILAGSMLLLIPLAAGWQRPGMLEASALLASYLFALLLVMMNVWRLR